MVILLLLNLNEEWDVKIMKSLVKLIIIVGFTGIAGGLFSYFAHPIFWNEYKSPNQDIEVLIFYGLIVSLVVYIIYKISTNYILNWTNLGKGLLCIFAVFILLIIIGTFQSGMSIKGLIYGISSLGTANFIIPYLDSFLTKCMAQSYSN
jgi:small-conductance mechanosensitive channel